MESTQAISSVILWPLIKAGRAGQQLWRQPLLKSILLLQTLLLEKSLQAKVRQIAAITVCYLLCTDSMHHKKLLQDLYRHACCVRGFLSGLGQRQKAAQSPLLLKY